MSVVFLACMGGLRAQSLDSLAVQLSSPYQALRIFVDHIQEDNYYPAVAAAPFLTHTSTPQEAAQYATMLKQILDGKGYYLDLDIVPRKENYRDTLSKIQRYTLFAKHPDIYLQREKQAWHFSAHTIQNIRPWHEEVFPLGTSRLLHLLPTIGTKRIGSLPLWKIFSILLLIALCFFVHKGLSFLTKRIIFRQIARMGYTHMAQRYLPPIARPISLFIVFFLLLLFVPVLQFPATVSRYMLTGIRVCLPIFTTISLYHMVNLFAVYLEKVAKRTINTLDDQLVILIRKVLKTFVLALGFLFVLDSLSIPIIPLLTGLSIGGLAVALAAQDTIKNFFGSLMIFIDKPFQIGHWITCGDIDGVVEEVGFRSTRVRTFRNSVIYVPNAKLADSMVDNHGLRQYRRYYTTLHLLYDTSPEQLQAFIQGLKYLVQQHPRTLKDNSEIHLTDLKSEGLSIMFYIFFEAKDWSEELQARHEINAQILHLAAHLSIHFSYGMDLALHMQALAARQREAPHSEKPSPKNWQKELNTYFQHSLKT